MSVAMARATCESRRSLPSPAIRLYTPSLSFSSLEGADRAGGATPALVGDGIRQGSPPGTDEAEARSASAYAAASLARAAAGAARASASGNPGGTAEDRLAERAATWSAKRAASAAAAASAASASCTCPEHS
eukprot:1291283-Pyramimonas_sp.AAC.1